MSESVKVKMKAECYLCKEMSEEFGPYVVDKEPMIICTDCAYLTQAKKITNLTPVNQ